METNQAYLSKLQALLSSYQVHYQNLRALHWNIQGEKFFELHLKYEELYNRTQLIIDELAERLLTLGARPLFRYSDYLQNSLMTENKLITNGVEGMTYILNAQKQLLIVEKELLRESGELEDEGTNAFISDLVREKEKSNWMFSSWLGLDKK